MIALLCPSRGRPQQFKRMVESALKTASRELQIYLCVSPQDHYNYKEVCKDYWHLLKVMIAPAAMPTAHKWNLMAQEMEADLYMIAADDMIFTTPCWDEVLHSHYDRLDNKIHVYALRDSRDELGTPHPIISREYRDKMGFLIPPIFTHWTIDTWTVEIAKANDCFTHFKDYLLVHQKPSDNGVFDETHTTIRDAGWHERDMWVASKSQDILGMYKRKLANAFWN